MECGELPYIKLLISFIFFARCLGQSVRGVGLLVLVCRCWVDNTLLNGRVNITIL
jgi:hypothetical protein